MGQKNHETVIESTHMIKYITIYLILRKYRYHGNRLQKTWSMLKGSVIKFCIIKRKGTLSRDSNYRYRPRGTFGTTAAPDNPLPA